MKLVRESLNEKFKEKSDPIADMGIGLMPEIERALQSIVDEYDLDVPVDKMNDDFYHGYSFLYEKGKHGAYYSITYSENGLEANYTDNNQPYDDNQECETVEEAREVIAGWIEYAQENW